MQNKGSIIPKTFTSSYLYNKNGEQQNKKLFNFIMKSERIDTSSDEFADIMYNVKRRQVANWLYKILMSKNVVLCYSDAPLSRAFKVFAAKDVKEAKNETKVFIDVSDIVKKVDGKWNCNNVDILIAYLLSATNTFIYYKDPSRIIMKSNIFEYGSIIFSKLFTNIVDYLYKISITPGVRDKCLYLSSMYFNINILGKEMDNSLKSLCRRISGLSEREEEVLLYSIEDKDFENIHTFIDKLNEILKLSKLTLDTFVEKWLFLYGVGTTYALELYPAFASLVTNVYIGCYINNQKTIEKVVGKDIVTFTVGVLSIGGEAV